MSSADAESNPVRERNRRRQKLLREFRLSTCIEVDDPTMPKGKRRLQMAEGCPHGTEGGYTNWLCQCAFVPGTEELPNPKPGCNPVGTGNSAARAERTNANAETRELPTVTPRRRNAEGPSRGLIPGGVEPQPNPNGRHHRRPGDPGPVVPASFPRGTQRHARDRC